MNDLTMTLLNDPMAPPQFSGTGSDVHGRANAGGGKQQGLIPQLQGLKQPGPIDMNGFSDAAGGGNASSASIFGSDAPNVVQGFQNGGDPIPGQTSIVGENGPELITPKIPTTITPLLGGDGPRLGPGLRDMINPGPRDEHQEFLNSGLPSTPSPTGAPPTSGGLNQPLTNMIPPVDPRKQLEDSLVAKIQKYEDRGQQKIDPTTGQPIPRGFWGSLGHGLSQTGLWQNTASEKLKRAGNEQNVKDLNALEQRDVGMENAKSLAGLRDAQTEYNRAHATQVGTHEVTAEEAEAMGHPELKGSMIDSKNLYPLIKARDTSKTGMAEHGLKFDDSGNIIPDEDSPIYKQQQLKDDVLKAQADYTRAGITLRQAQTELDKAKADPNSPAFKMAQERLAIAQQNATAANTRAQAYMGNYLQNALGQTNPALTGQPAQALPGASVITDAQGKTEVIGARSAGAASKAQSNVAMFNDVYGAFNRVEDAARALVNKGGSLNSLAVSLALAQPPGTFHQWLQGAGIKSGLTPEEREYVTQVQQAHENVQALRKSAGGIATDQAVAKLDALVPNASTPDLPYLLKQIGTVRATADRLSKGVTTAQGGLKLNKEEGRETQNAPTSTLKIGDVRPGADGSYRYKGGDQYDKNSWEKVVK
jgi:hypothetical protein